MYFRYKWLFVFLLTISISVVFINTTNAQTQCPSGKQWSINCGKCVSVPATSGSCSSPADGVYNACGDCICSASKTLCNVNGVSTCKTPVAASCQPGQTYDPCTGCVGKASVILNPDSAQSGLINITGDLKSAGDLYLANGKAIRADGSGITDLYFGNWGTGATGINVRVLGGLKVGLGTTSPLQIGSDGTLLTSGSIFVGLTASNPGTNGLSVSGKIIAGSGGITLGGENKATWPTSGKTYTGIANQISVDNTAATIGLANNPTVPGLLTVSGDLQVKGTGNSIFAGKVGVNTTQPSTTLDVAGTLKATQICLGDVCSTILPTSSQWTSVGVTGEHINYNKIGGNVGIGLDSSKNQLPSEKLTVNGNISLWNSLYVLGSGDSYFTGKLGIGTATPSRQLEVNGQIGTDDLCLGSICKNVWPTSSQWTTNGLKIYYNNPVGISKADPQYPLDVLGSINGTGLCINGTCKTTWPVGSQWTSNGNDIYYTTGKVGIGYATPAYALDVGGDMRLETRLRFKTADAWTDNKHALIALDAGAGKKISFYNFNNSKGLMTIDGDTGDVAVTGAITENGKAVLSDYQTKDGISVLNLNVSGDITDTATASCASGYSATGGGCDCGEGSMPNGTVIYSIPKDGLTGWKCACSWKSLPSGSSVQVKAYAVCAK